VQVSQVSESESVVRPPQDRILGIGTKIVIRTAVVDGVTITYWRALNLFATYYIPVCIPGDCHPNTATGKPVQKGMAAFVYPWFLFFAHERLYVPGYGFATVEDNNGANVNALGETYWIDLGYSLTEKVDWVNHYVTVYFLTPIAANYADTYVLP
jgi:3D (Asp-Asp-Asp) domain-containing protein